MACSWIIIPQVLEPGDLLCPWSGFGALGKIPGNPGPKIGIILLMVQNSG